MLVHKRYARLIVFLLSCLILTGCMVGPDFHTPKSPPVHTYTESTLPAKTVRVTAGNAGHAQQFVANKDLPVEWWYLFHSPVLNRLITIGISNSPNLASAYAALRSAQETLKAQIGSSYFPNIGASLNSTRNRFSDVSIGVNAPSSVFNTFFASVSVSYTLDVFGGLRRQVEGLRAQVDYQQFQLIAAYLTLTTNIVTTAITIASFQSQIHATHALIKAQADQLAIIKQQYQLGGVSSDAVYTQETLLNQTKATLNPLEKSLSQSKHLLAILVGHFPNEQIPVIDLDTLILPETLPVSLPSLLVRQRPDVRASEALLHSASANIGVATANLLPQFPLSANTGWESFTLAGIFSPSHKTWLLNSIISQPIFQGGALFAKRRQAIAAYDQAAAQYRQTVLTAFQNVADTLRALEIDAKNLRDQVRALHSAQKNLSVVQNQYKLGGANYLSLLNAQQQYQNVLLAVIQAKTLRYNDTAALFQALGGGWWNKSWCVPETLGAPPRKTLQQSVKEWL